VDGICHTEVFLHDEKPLLAGSNEEVSSDVRRLEEYEGNGDIFE